MSSEFGFNPEQAKKNLRLFEEDPDLMEQMIEVTINDNSFPDELDGWSAEDVGKFARALQRKLHEESIEPPIQNPRKMEQESHDAQLLYLQTLNLILKLNEAQAQELFTEMTSVQRLQRSQVFDKAIKKYFTGNN